MKIKGKYKREMGFIYVYSNNTVYTISIYDGNWSCCKVGNRTAMGQILTQEAYDRWESECSKVGEFELKQRGEENMKKYYVFEDNYDVEIFESKGEAVRHYEISLDRLTKEEKKNLEYFRLYEIETDTNPNDYEGDLIDLITEMIFKIKQEWKNKREDG